MHNFATKRIRIAPKTAMSIAFRDYLLKQITCNFLGFIDKSKNDSDVIHLESLNPNEVDAIIIVSPNHFHAIYQDCLNFIDMSKLYLVHIQNQSYHLTQHIEKKATSLIEYYSKERDNAKDERQGIAFISKGFIGSNNKFFYLYCIHHNLSCIMITDNQKQLQSLNQYNLPCVKLDTEEGDKAIAKAKYLIFDQGNYTYFYISPNQITIQLWHGVGLKKMSPHTHITYDYFVSTSKWSNDTNFKHIFKAKHFVDYGYPRNEFLVKEDEELYDLLFCDKTLLETVKSKQYNKIVLYMPTTREYLFGTEATLENLLPLHLDELNKQLADINTLMIIKLHPFIIEFFQKNCSFNDFSHIAFHSPDGDVYPILKYTDVLVSDYSSIVYDFLLLDRPIIFFDYDRKRYEENMGGFLFDYDAYSPGKKVSTEEELIHAISLTEDSFVQERKRIAALFLKPSPTNDLLRKLIE